jgi:hypothetical protein
MFESMVAPSVVPAPTTGIVDLANTIMDKIAGSDAFVADVTCVGAVTARMATDENEKPKEKKLINSNVAIELGYAMNCLKGGKLILVFNQAYGSYEDLPFDLRHKGGAIITFNLPAGADKERRKREAAPFKGKLKRSLGEILRNAKQVAASVFEETPSTYCKATYFEKGEVLATYGETEEEMLRYSYDATTLFYVRLIPTQSLSTPFTREQMLRAAPSAPLLFGGPPTSGYFVDNNKYGVINWRPGSHPSSGPAAIAASLQIMRNGELWANSISPLNKRPIPQQDVGLKYPLIPYKSFEQVYRTFLNAVIKFSGDYLEVKGPWYVVFGISGIKDVYLAPYAPGEFVGGFGQIGPFYDDEVMTRILVSAEKDSQNKALLTFFQKVWEEAGSKRPASLYNFPSGQTM